MASYENAPVPHEVHLVPTADRTRIPYDPAKAKVIWTEGAKEGAKFADMRDHLAARGFPDISQDIIDVISDAYDIAFTHNRPVFKAHVMHAVIQTDAGRAVFGRAGYTDDVVEALGGSLQQRLTAPFLKVKPTESMTSNPSEKPAIPNLTDSRNLMIQAAALAKQLGAEETGIDHLVAAMTYHHIPDNDPLSDAFARHHVNPGRILDAVLSHTVTPVVKIPEPLSAVA